MKEILIIDDDLPIGNMLQEILEREGYAVLRSYSGTEALLLLESKTPDLILLDLMLPGLSGEALLPRIKEIPTMIVSAKIGIDSKVDLLLGGAVDYITKPFEIKELLARIAVVFRDHATKSAHLTFDSITLNTENRTVAADQTEIKLTRTEYAILKYLMQN